MSARMHTMPTMFGAIDWESLKNDKPPRINRQLIANFANFFMTL